MFKKHSLVVAISLLLGSVSLSAQISHFTTAQEAQIKALVKETLMKDPTIIEDAIIELQNIKEREKTEQQKAALEKNHEKLFNDPNSPRIGADETNSQLTIVYFTDYNCAYCKRFEEELDKLHKRYPQVTIVLKPLGWLSEGSVKAAEMALALWKKDPAAFEKLHLALIKEKTTTPESLAQRLKDLSIEPAEITEESLATLKNNMELARELGITGTPTTVIGKNLIPGLVSFESLEAIIKNELEKPKAEPEEQKGDAEKLKAEPEEQKAEPEEIKTTETKPETTKTESESSQPETKKAEVPEAEVSKDDTKMPEDELKESSN